MTAFSWELYIDGFQFEHFGKISISQNVDKYGTSGVVTAMMTVSTYGNIGTGENVIASNAEVRLICSDENIKPPVFYVTKRVINGNITTWTCCDIMSKAERHLDFEDSDFTDDKLTVETLMDIVSEQCGFTSIDYTPIRLMLTDKIDRQTCETFTARDVLELISCTMCGYWIGNVTTIAFVPFGTNFITTELKVCSDITFGAAKHFSRVICTDENDVYTSGTGDNSQTLICESEFANQDKTDSILITMLNGKEFYTYQAWSCAKGIAESWVHLGEIIFNHTVLSFNSVTMHPSPNGLYVTISRNNISEDETEYTSDIYRKLARKVELNKINNNVSIRRDGLFFFENGYKKLTDEQKKDSVYSFNVDKGVTEYSGTMVDMVTPSSASINADKTEAVIDYGGKKYKYHITWDGGNISGLTKEVIE